MSRIPFFLLTFTLAHLSAQNVRIGMKGGLRATNDIESRDGKASESRPYALGPMLEVGLPLGLSVEAMRSIPASATAPIIAILSDIRSTGGARPHGSSLFC